MKSEATRRLALEMYLEGLGFRAIGRLLKVSYVTVYYWIKAWGEQASSIQSQQKVSIVEIDEMHTYIRSKKTISGYGLLLIDWGKGLSLMSVDAEG